jgi:hypothetical protein
MRPHRPSVPLLALVAGALLAASPALAGSGGALRAQAFDAPSLWTPYSEDGMGLYLVDPDGGDIGALFTWRRSGRVVDFGLRGAVQDAGGQVGLSGGLELGGALYRASASFPLDVAWGSGIGIGGVPDRDLAVVRIPLGISFGRRLAVGDIGLIPYVEPRLAVDIRVRGPRPARNRSFGGGDHTSLHLNLNLGADLDFRLAWRLRIGGTVGQERTVAAGIVFPGF